MSPPSERSSAASTVSLDIQFWCELVQSMLIVHT